MGKVLGIVGEYNPFHNGHLYHLEQAKKKTHSNYTVAVMSGNFTQRGSTSLIDKWSKAEAAIKSGIDLIIELPVIYATSSAENFADGAIKILNSLKVVDYISFGAENSDLETLKQISDILDTEPREYKSVLTRELKTGISFPKARENALMTYLGGDKKYENIISSPNNILGVEYLKALKNQKSKIEPVAIGRYEAGYNDNTYTDNIASATAIRNIVKNGGFDILRKLLPPDSYTILMENIKQGHIVPDLSVFEKEIIFNLRYMSLEEIADLPDVSEGLESAIKKAADSCNNLEDFFNIIQSKRYTNTRIQRILLYSLLGITKREMLISKKTMPYVRVLGLNKRGKYLISEIAKANPKLEIVTSVKRFLDSNVNKNLKTMIDIDNFSTDVYTIGYQFDSASKLDFTKKIIVVN